MAKSKKIKLIINTALIIISAVLIISILKIINCFPGQFEYERWQGDNDLEFSQQSCFIPESDNITLSNINAFRTSMVEAFTKASLDTTNKLFVDCWSCEGTCTISTDKAYTTAPVLAVGGEFFDFHPYTFTCGSSFNEDTSLTDIVVLDEELAWYLFGSTDVAGLTVNINQNTFYVAGVVERESDFASEKAYTGGMGLFMPYLSYYNMNNSSAPITCYEAVIPDPVKNFASNLVSEKFPSKNIVSLENSGRFSFSNFIKIIGTSSSRVMSSTVAYPYWENAARYGESICAELLLVSLLLLIYPCVTLIILAVKYIKLGYAKLSNDLLPRVKENTEESIRIRQRKKWLKNHPGQK